MWATGHVGDDWGRPPEGDGSVPVGWPSDAPCGEWSPHRSGICTISPSATFLEYLRH